MQICTKKTHNPTGKMEEKETEDEETEEEKTEEEEKEEEKEIFGASVCNGEIFSLAITAPAAAAAAVIFSLTVSYMYILKPVIKVMS